MPNIKQFKNHKDYLKEKINRKFNGYGGALGFTKTELIDLLELTDGK